MKIEVTQYSMSQAITVNSEYQREYDEFYREWGEEIANE